ncbi:O-antigen ligase family protein [Pseudoalteromonas tunicata]|uniref:O-antigen ligase family protein n=1 Tax=Pseudoalteromonas tunicata TaxID=314281 RepID=UPI00273D8CFE|nr:O-antigen ligase family protein [Pseudoalteromonas tunicata]MDP4985549.1 O-antigen ligase family protein [Pseudoalteromonas tunicata]
MWLTGLFSLLIIVLYEQFGFVAAFAIVLLPFGAVMAVQISTFFIILFILFSYFRLHEAFPILMPLKIPKLLALASLAGIVWHLFISRKLKPHWHTGHLVFCLLFFWLTVSVFAAKDRPLAMMYWSDIMVKVFLMVFVISWWLKTVSAFNWVRFGIMISGTLVACVALYNKANGIGLVEGTRVTISREFRSQIGDPNDLSLVLMFPVSFLAAEMFSSANSNWKRFFALLGLCTVIAGIIATQSRGGLLGICAVLGYFIYQKVKNPVIVMAIGGAAMLVLLAVAGISDRQSGGAAEEGVDASAMGRIYAWQAAINMATSNPLTGVGVNNFISNYYFYSPHWDGKNHAVHSTWFQVLGETGFVGLALYFVMIAIIIKSLRRSYLISLRLQNDNLALNANALRAGLLGFVVAGTFLTQAFTWPIYILLSLSLALEKMANEQLIEQ